jgi:signal transduction histidine kinase
MAQNAPTNAHSADWLAPSLRGLLLVILALVFFIYDSQAVTRLANPLIIGALGVVVLAATLAVAPLRRFTIICALAVDLLIVGLFTFAAQGNSILLLAAVGGVLFVGIMDYPFNWNAFQIVGALAVCAIVNTLNSATGTGNPMSGLFAAVALGLLALGAAYAAERRVGMWRGATEELARYRQRQADIMSERTRAIYEVAYAMSSTLKYEKVLDAALEAGYLGMNLSRTSGVIAGVFLFHADDNLLHLVSARGFARTDSDRTLRGVDGMVGQALREVTPVFGGSVRSDPELGIFVGLQQARSVLVIPLCARFDNFGILLYASDRQNAFSRDQSDMLTAIGVHATIALQNALLYRELVEEKERIVKVDEEARKKLARDLHDGATQSIAAIAMRMSYIYKLLERSPNEVIAELKKVEDLARKTTKEIRHILFTLRPLVLETQGLMVALNQFAEKMRETYQQAVSIRVEQEVESYLDHHQQGIIFYIIEEAVNNARKHAQASLITVTLKRLPDSVMIEIRDNGVGFDMSRVTSAYDLSGSLGLVNMRERAELLHGSLSIESSEGSGTTITVVIPFHAPDMTPVGGVPSLKRGTTKLALAAHNRDQSKTKIPRP